MGDEGFWGPVDSAVDFCEPNYASTWLIAETFNALSSIFYIVAGAEGAYRAFHNGSNASILVSFFTLVMVGTGSMIFHVTMRSWGEIWDVIPMLLLTQMILWTLQNTHPLLDMDNGFGVYTYFGTFLLTLLSLIAYVTLRVYDIFMTSFTIQCTFAGILTIFAQRHTRTAARYVWAFIICILTGKILLEIEKVYCDSIPFVWISHVGWHIFSCLAVYYWVLCAECIQHERSIKKGKILHDVDDVAKLDKEVAKRVKDFSFQLSRENRSLSVSGILENNLKVLKNMLKRTDFDKKKNE